MSPRYNKGKQYTYLTSKSHLGRFKATPKTDNDYDFWKSKE